MWKTLWPFPWPFDRVQDFLLTVIELRTHAHLLMLLTFNRGICDCETISTSSATLITKGLLTEIHQRHRYINTHLLTVHTLFIYWILWTVAHDYHFKNCTALLFYSDIFYKLLSYFFHIFMVILFSMFDPWLLQRLHLLLISFFHLRPTWKKNLNYQHCDHSFCKCNTHLMDIYFISYYTIP